MTVRLALTYIICQLHGPYLYGEGPLPEDWESYHITLSLLCPCHEYTPLLPLNKLQPYGALLLTFMASIRSNVYDQF